MKKSAAIALLLVTAPAHAWEVRTSHICELVHEESSAAVRVTYDPAIPEYAIEITLPDAWAGSAVFAMRFDGPRPNTISTSRHVISGDRSTLSVSDTGFGNVLNGLEFNRAATAILGNQSVTVGLDGAAPAVRQFRACTSGLTAWNADRGPTKPRLILTI